MGSDLKAYRITDYKEALYVLSDVSIESVIYEDGYRFQMPDLIKDIYVGVKVKGELAACYRMEQKTTALWQLHANVLKQFRREHSIDITKAVLRFYIDHVPGFEVSMSWVPLVHPNVIAHVEKFDVEITGIIKNAYRKNGKLVDVMIYTMSRENIIKMLGEE